MSSQITKKRWLISINSCQHVHLVNHTWRSIAHRNDQNMYYMQGHVSSSHQGQYTHVVGIVITWISLRYRATSFSMPSPSLSLQLISFSRAISLSITDGSERLKDKKKKKIIQDWKTACRTVSRMFRSFGIHSTVQHWVMNLSSSNNRWQGNWVCISSRDPSRLNSCSQGGRE